MSLSKKNQGHSPVLSSDFLPLGGHGTLFQGAVTHEDFEGHLGTIKAGDVQWMTAGRGIVHSEMPAGPGTSKGLQLWVNLSSGNKMYVTLSSLSRRSTRRSH